MTETAALQDVLILLLTLIVCVPLGQRLRIGSVFTFLVAGVLIGPSLFGLIDNIDAAESLGHFGVVFLLFAVGLELKVERLRLFGWRVIGLAFAQIAVTTIVLGAVALAVGLEPMDALVVGTGLSLSSTAVVLQSLGERTPLTAPLGRTTLAILLLQDLLVGPALIFVSVAADSSADLAEALLAAALKTAVVVVVIFSVERTVLRRLLRYAAVGSAPEVFTGMTLFLVLATSWVTEQAGLSLALGAFLAGLMVADTEFRHQVAADIQPFRGLFLGLFFTAVGMTIDVNLAIDRAGAITVLVIGLIAGKWLVLTGLALAFGVPRRRAIALGGLLGQGSEFAFVLFALSADGGLLARDLASLLTVAVGVSMAVSAVGTAVVRHRLRARMMARSTLGRLSEEGGRLSGHVVVAGFGQVGMAVTRHLLGQHISIVVLDLNARRVSASRARGLPVFYGNATRLDVLRAAHLDRASVLVVAVPEAEAAEQITAVARAACPRLHIMVRVPDSDWVQRLRKAGANAVALDGLTTALELAERVVLVHEPAPVPANDVRPASP